MDIFTHTEINQEQITTSLAKRTATVLAAVCMLIFQGCETLDVQPPDPTQTLSRFQSRSFSDPEITNAFSEAGLSVPRTDAVWTLKDLMVVAETMHPALKLAIAEKKSLEAAIDVANAPNPLGIGVDLQRATSTASPWTAGFSLSALIQTANKRGIATQQAQSEFNQSLLRASQLRWQTDSAVSHALLDYHVAAERARTIEQTIALFGTLKELQQKRLNLGEGTTLESIAVQQEIAQLNTQLAEARKQNSTATAALASALGMPLQSLQAIKITPWAPQNTELPTLETLTQQTAITHPSVLLELNDYATQEAKLRLALAGQYPDIQLGPGYSYDQGQHKWILGLGITLPVNGNKPAIRQAQADVDRSIVQVETTQQTVIHALEAAWVACEQSKQILSENRLMQQQNEAFYSAQQHMFDVGESDRMSLIRAHIQLQLGALALLDSQLTLASDLLHLQDALCAPINQ